MEVPRLELEDLELAKLVTKLVEPLVITVEKQKRMIEILEKELDLGLQHGLTGQKPCSVLVMIVVSSRDSSHFETGIKFGRVENNLRSFCGQGQDQSRWKTHSFHVSSMGNVRLSILLVIYKMQPPKQDLIIKLGALSPQVRVRQVFRP